MTDPRPPIPAWQLYGENSPFPDLMHIERIVDRAAGHDWKIAPHRHVNLHQIFLILSGQITLTVDGTGQSPPPPVLMNIPVGTVHGFAFAAGTEGWVLTLPAADFPELFGQGAATQGALSRVFALPPPAGLEQDFAAIAALHAGIGPFRRLRLRAATLGICCTVAEAGGPAGAATTAGDPRIARFETLVRGHLTDNWQLADYAAALALSERHLRRLCLAATGLSAHGLVEAIRQREACRLLAYTQMQVKDVAYALGYDDPAYFARAFRRGAGLSPAAYRARLDHPA